jgi:hypothetical protein
MFSFGIGDRFKKSKPALNHSIGYMPGSTMTQKTTSFGFGERVPLTKGSRYDKLPEPGQYNMPS